MEPLDCFENLHSDDLSLMTMEVRGLGSAEERAGEGWVPLSLLIVAMMVPGLAEAAAPPPVSWELARRGWVAQGSLRLALCSHFHWSSHCNHFSMYNSVAQTAFTLLCNHGICFQNFSNTPNGNLVTVK